MEMGILFDSESFLIFFREPLCFKGDDLSPGRFLFWNQSSWVPFHFILSLTKLKQLQANRSEKLNNLFGFRIHFFAFLIETVFERLGKTLLLKIVADQLWLCAEPEDVRCKIR